MRIKIIENNKAAKHLICDVLYIISDSLRRNVRSGHCTVSAHNIFWAVWEINCYLTIKFHFSLLNGSMGTTYFLKKILNDSFAMETLFVVWLLLWESKFFSPNSNSSLVWPSELPHFG